ncbi:MAG TPA: hypothetical protein VNK67_05955 [Burkholderiales bacterium]|nr:hypothetical protein [Burkholderiales bacterium]
MDDLDEIIECIEQGMTTERDAVIVSGIIARAMRYESALREIAVYGRGQEAMTALQALIGICATEGHA